MILSIDFFAYSFSLDGTSRFVNQSSLTAHQTLFINFNLKNLLSQKVTDTQFIRKSFICKDTLTTICKISFYNKF